jgi:fatty acid desaturase
LERRRPYYLWWIAAMSGLYVAGWAVFVALGDSPWQLLVAPVLAVVFGQLGFLGHDAGHRQIFRSRRANDLVGLLLGNLGIGMSYGWWVDKHNRHHAHPNHEERDPDISIRALAFTAGQAGSKRGLTRLIARHQGVLFGPMLLGEALHLHLASIRAVVTGGSPGRRITLRHRRWEALLLGLHTVGYATIVFAVLSPVWAVGFIVAQQALLGLYLGCAFAPNHKGMPILRPDDELDYLRRQVLTSRNVHGSWFLDVALGGLNYQIEHHLFPSLPRPNLRRARDLVLAFCRERGIPYCETSLWRSYALAVGHLHAVGAAVRA